MRRKSINETYLFLPLLVLFFIAIGYASLESNISITGEATIIPNSININGTITTNSNDLNIYITNLTIKQGSVSNTPPIIENSKNLNFNITLPRMGDFYEFSFDVVNDSSKRALLKELSSTNLTEEQSKILDLVYTYEDGTPVLENDLLNANTTRRIKVIVKFKDDINRDDLPNSNLSIALPVSIEYEQERINLYNMIKANAKTDAINFSVNSMASGTNGIYTTTSTDSGKAVYYYRGKVDNNIIFGGYCWKIIRTTETNGIKIIYNGKPNNGVCSATGTEAHAGTSAYNTLDNDNAYVGYMYGKTGATSYNETHKNTNNSTLKTYLEGDATKNGWFETSGLVNYLDKLEDTPFCNDRNIVNVSNNSILSGYGTLGYGLNRTGYGMVSRASYYTITPNPTLKCTNTKYTGGSSTLENQNNDRFTVSTLNGNGKLKYPVGLITIDEAVFGGCNTKQSNPSNYIDRNTYLFTNTIYWTFTPFVINDNSAMVGTVSNVDGMSDGNVYRVSGVRPVVSLKPETMVVGIGTQENPFVVK